MIPITAAHIEEMEIGTDLKKSCSQKWKCISTVLNKSLFISWIYQTDFFLSLNNISHLKFVPWGKQHKRNYKNYDLRSQVHHVFIPFHKSSVCFQVWFCIQPFKYLVKLFSALSKITSVVSVFRVCFKLEWQTLSIFTVKDNFG